MECEDIHSNSSKYGENGGLDTSFMYKKWGQIPLRCLPTKIAVELDEIVKTAKPVLADEPLLPTICQAPSDSDSYSSSYFASSATASKRDRDPFRSYDVSYMQNVAPAGGLSFRANKKQSPVHLQPSIDSYIVNTIKLNEILKNRIPFDQVEFFQKYEKRKESGKESNKKQKQPSNQSANGAQNDKVSSQSAAQFKIQSDEEARKHLRRFISIMAIHAGFNQSSSVGLDILVDVLDHFIESFFKLFKNLQSVNQFDPNSKESTKQLASSSFYSPQLFIEQVFKESGFGSLQKLKEFYLNDIVEYHRQTYKKVNKLYEEHKKKKLAERLAKKSGQSQMDADTSDVSEIKTENEIKMEEFMRENDFLNEESNSLLGDLLLGDLGTTLPYKHLSYILD